MIHGVIGFIFISERQCTFCLLSPVSRSFGKAPWRVKNKIAGQTMDDWKTRLVIKSMLPHIAMVGNRQEPRKLQESVRQWAIGGGGVLNASNLKFECKMYY